MGNTDAVKQTTWAPSSSCHDAMCRLMHCSCTACMV